MNLVKANQNKLSVGLLILFGAAVLALAYLYFKPKTYSDDTLVIGVFPRRPAATTQQMYSSMVHYLAKELGMRVRLKTADSFDKFWKGVENGQYDLVHFNQYHYLVSHARHGYTVIAMNEEQNRSTITGIVVVRKDSGINTIADLKGRKIVFGGGPKAMQSYIYARYLLEQGGLSVNDYVTAFDPSPLHAVLGVYHGLKGAVAAGAGDAILRAVGKRINLEDMKILASGQQYAHLPWAVKRRMDPAMKRRLSEALLAMKNDAAGRQVLKKAKLTNILPATDADYDPHRRIVKAVFGENY